MINALRNIFGLNGTKKVNAYDSRDNYMMYHPYGHAWKDIAEKRAIRRNKWKQLYLEEKYINRIIEESAEKKSYQHKAAQTLLPSSKNMPYLVAGLASESLEVFLKLEFPNPTPELAELIEQAREVEQKFSKFKKGIRDSGQMPPECNYDWKQIRDELGDTKWYSSLIALLIGCSDKDVEEFNIQKLRSRKQRGVLSGSGDKR